MTIKAFLLTFSVLLVITLDGYGSEEKHPYVPKRFRPPKNVRIKSMLKPMCLCADLFFNKIANMRVRRKYCSQGPRVAGPRRRWYKKVLWDRLLHDSIPVMTTTWEDSVSKTPSGRQFYSDSRTLVIDDGASACITNDKGDFIEPPTKVNRKVRGIKGHAKATHRGTIKWHVEDDTSLTHVMIIMGA